MTDTSGLVVLGPYRSGTSLTCQMLMRLGVDFGPSDAFWRADRYNPGGFVERLDVNHANGRLLESIGRTIADPVDPAEVLVRGDRGVLDEVDLSWRGERGRWGLKDPRFCFTLAVWAAHGCFDLGTLRLVVVHRDVDATAASILGYPTLQRLLGGDAGRARGLARACADGAQWQVEQLGVDTHEVRYEQVLARPRETAAELAAWLGVDEPGLIRAAAALVGKRRATTRYHVGRVWRRLAG